MVVPDRSTPPDDFFTGGIAQIPARPLRRFPRAFREGISFRRGGAISFQISVGKKLINGFNVLPGVKI